MLGIINNKLSPKILGFWDNFLGFWELPENWETKLILHKKGSQIDEDEIFILEVNWSWRIISVSTKYEDMVRKMLESDFDERKLKKIYEKATNWKMTILWPIITSYLDNEQEKEDVIDWRIQILEDKKLFDDFVKWCKDNEMKEVNMEFWNPSHKFFAFNVDWDIVSLGNYSMDDKKTIGHIWIVTPKRFSWKWYWKILVKAMVKDIIDNWLIPQYRTSKDNIASQKIALSLWFKKIMESYSLVKRKD